MAFNPDGSTLAASGFDGITLWDITKPTSPTASFTVGTVLSDEPDLYYQAIQFSPDGRQLLSSSRFGNPFAFAIWNVFQKELFVQPFLKEDVSQGSLAFSPDSQHLVSIFIRDTTNILLLWDIMPSTWQTLGCDIAHRNLTIDEWDQFVKDEQPRTQVCTRFPLDS